MAHVTPHPYENCVVLFIVVLCCSYRILICSSKGGEWQRANPVLVTCGIICSNLGIWYILLTGVKMHQWRDWFFHQRKDAALLGSGSSTADLFEVRLLVRSFGVALCWKSKDYWCQKKVPARTLLVVGKTLVIITILIWCLPYNGQYSVCFTSWLVWGSNRRRNKHFFLFKIDKTGSGLTQPLFQGYPGSLPGFKQPGRQVNHSCPSRAEVNLELYIYAPFMSSW